MLLLNIQFRLMTDEKSDFSDGIKLSPFHQNFPQEIVFGDKTDLFFITCFSGNGRSLQERKDEPCQLVS